MKQKKKSTTYSLDSTAIGIKFVPNNESKREKSANKPIKHQCNVCNKLVVNAYGVFDAVEYYYNGKFVNPHGRYYCDECIIMTNIRQNASKDSFWIVINVLTKKRFEYHAIRGDTPILQTVVTTKDGIGKVVTRKGMYHDPLYNKWEELKAKKKKDDLELMRKGLL